MHPSSVASDSARFVGLHSYHLGMDFPVISSQALGEISKIIDESQIHISGNDCDWKGNRLLHCEVASEWSLQFECWLLDPCLSPNLGVMDDEHFTCRVPSRVSQIKITQAILPDWSLCIGQPFACQAELFLADGKKHAKIPNKSCIWPVGTKMCDAPMNLVHFFSGAFNGWHQAQQFICQCQGGPTIDTTISIDNDPIVCRYSAMNMYAQHIQPFGRDSKEICRNIVVQAKVQDSSWMKYIHNGQNAIWTASFPCQPFSRGGKMTGLDTQDGRALLYVLKRARIFQPLAICLENVDGFDRHPHRRFIMNFIQWAGYRKVWSQVQNLNVVSPTSRARWLGVFVRKDIDALQSFGANIDVQYHGKVGWNHPTHQFQIPDELQDSLIINMDIFHFYNYSSFMPISMKKKGEGKGIKSRIPEEQKDLATLVASYSTQHCLPPSHLSVRGIFAEVVPTKDQHFAFIDPCKWYSLMGAIQSFVFPNDMGIAFHHLGNCISVPQAVLALSVACESTRVCNFHATFAELVCAAWEARITAHKACITKVGGDFGLLFPDDFLMYLQRESDMESEEHESSISIRWPDEMEFRYNFRNTENVNSFLERIGFPKHLVKDWGIFIKECKLPVQRIDTFPQGHWHGFFFFGDKSEKFPEMQVEFTNEDFPQEISPTLPWTIPDDEPVEKFGDVKVTLPDDQIRELTCLNSRTIEEILILAGHVEKPDEIIHAFVNHLQIDLSVIVGSISADEIVFKTSKKRKIQESHQGCVLEVTTLAGVTRFIPTNPLWTIEQTLIDAGFPETFIARLTPQVQGKSIPLNTCVGTLNEPFVRLRCFPLKGGVVTKQNDEDAPMQDAVFQNDPWAAWKKPTQTQVRWDQLRLPDNHPFFSGSSRLKQVQAMQIGPEISGIAFATRSVALSLIGKSVCGNTVLLLPGFKGMSNLPAELRSQAMPSQQVVVCEPDSSIRYKRLILPIVLKGKCDFKIEEPTNVIQIHSTQFIEIVLEIPSKIVNAPTRAVLGEKPLEHFQKALGGANFSMQEVSIYAFRKIKAKDHEEIFQTLAKVPKTVRDTALQFSGVTELFTRQFVEDPKDIDHSILPRYFDLSSEGIRMARQLGETIADGGYRGLALTSKGVAIRADNKHLESARLTVLQSDTRFNEQNRKVICRYFWQAQGFPFAISHQSIIEAVGQATSIFPVPLRSFKLSGMITWILAFEENPQKTLFQIKFDEKICEIILTPQDASNKQGKGSKMMRPNKGMQQKGKGQQWHIPANVSPNAASFQTTSGNKRLDDLESKVAKLEQQQGALADKVDSRFDQVAAQLQQVLQAVAPAPPKGRSSDGQTGMTPPPKQQKAA